MRIRAYWWGFLYIPETDDDVRWCETLKSFPEPECTCDDGIVDWVENYEEYNGSHYIHNTIIEFPLGKALRVGR